MVSLSRVLAKRPLVDVCTGILPIVSRSPEEILQSQVPKMCCNEAAPTASLSPFSKILLASAGITCFLGEGG